MKPLLGAKPIMEQEAGQPGLALKELPVGQEREQPNDCPASLQQSFLSVPLPVCTVFPMMLTSPLCPPQPTCLKFGPFLPGLL